MCRGCGFYYVLSISILHGSHCNNMIRVVGSAGIGGGMGATSIFSHWAVLVIAFLLTIFVIWICCCCLGICLKRGISVETKLPELGERRKSSLVWSTEKQDANRLLGQQYLLTYHKKLGLPKEDGGSKEHLEISMPEMPELQHEPILAMDTFNTNICPYPISGANISMPMPMPIS